MLWERSIPKSFPIPISVMASNFVAHPHIGGRNCGHIGNWRTIAGEEGFYRNDEIASWILGHFAELGTEFAEQRPAVGINHPTYSNVTSTEYTLGTSPGSIHKNWGLLFIHSFIMYYANWQPHTNIQ